MIPVTILTGFLGSGKTTLLKRILGEQHGMKIAIIENEFGEENIDNEILVQETNEQIIQMSNGCICCTIRGDLARALEDLPGQPHEIRHAGFRPRGDRNDGSGESRPGRADILHG